MWLETIRVRNEISQGRFSLSVKSVIAADQQQNDSGTAVIIACLEDARLAFETSHKCDGLLRRTTTPNLS